MVLDAEPGALYPEVGWLEIWDPEEPAKELCEEPCDDCKDDPNWGLE